MSIITSTFWFALEKIPFLFSNNNASVENNNNNTNSSSLTYPPEETWLQRLTKPANTYPIWEHSGLVVIKNWPNDLPRTPQEQEYFSSNTFNNYVIPAITFSVLFSIGVYTGKIVTKAIRHQISLMLQSKNKNRNIKGGEDDDGGDDDG